jgi:hypothetical protein
MKMLYNHESFIRLLDLIYLKFRFQMLLLPLPIIKLVNMPLKYRQPLTTVNSQYLKLLSLYLIFLDKALSFNFLISVVCLAIPYSFSIIIHFH